MIADEGVKALAVSLRSEPSGREAFKQGKAEHLPVKCEVEVGLARCLRESEAPNDIKLAPKVANEGL